MAENVFLTPLKNFLNSEHRKLMTPEDPPFEATTDYARHLKTVGLAEDFKGKAKDAAPLPADVEPEPALIVEPSRAEPVEFDDVQRVVVVGTTVQPAPAPAAAAPPAPKAKVARAPKNKMAPAPRAKVERKKRAAPAPAAQTPEPPPAAPPPAQT